MVRSPCDPVIIHSYIDGPKALWLVNNLITEIARDTEVKLMAISFDLGPKDYIHRTRTNVAKKRIQDWILAHERENMEITIKMNGKSEMQMQ